MNTPFSLRYVGSGGEIDFSGDSYQFMDNDLFDYFWNYTAQSIGQGYSIVSVEKAERVYSIEIAVLGDTYAETTLNLNRLQEIIDADVISKTQGRLYLNNQYLSGYFTALKSVANGEMVIKTASFVTGSPFWIEEELHEFPTFTPVVGTVLPVTFPFTFTSTFEARSLLNTHYASTKAVITMYGPCASPQFTLGSHLYRVMGVLGEGERVVIDQLNRTVTKITQTGEHLNAFAQRIKTPSVFDPIPTGETVLYSSGEYAIDILLLKERSEPLWS